MLRKNSVEIFVKQGYCGGFSPDVDVFGESGPSGISCKESMSYWGSGSASKMIPSITNPNATNSPNTKYHNPNSLKVGAGMSKRINAQNNKISKEPLAEFAV
jgi:hypothetical protein